MKTRPLFGICPLFGVSVKREFTALGISMYCSQYESCFALNETCTILVHSFLLTSTHNVQLLPVSQDILTMWCSNWGGGSTFPKYAVSSYSLTYYTLTLALASPHDK